MFTSFFTSMHIETVKFGIKVLKSSKRIIVPENCDTKASLILSPAVRFEVDFEKQ